MPEIETEDRLEIFQMVLDSFDPDERDSAQEEFWASVEDMRKMCVEEEGMDVEKFAETIIPMQGFRAGAPVMTILAACCRDFAADHPEMSPFELCATICSELPFVVQRLKTHTADYIFSHEEDDAIVYTIYVDFTARDDYGIYEYRFYFQHVCKGGEDRGKFVSFSPEAS